MADLLAELIGGIETTLHVTDLHHRLRAQTLVNYVTVTYTQCDCHINGALMVARPKQAGRKPTKAKPQTPALRKRAQRERDNHDITQKPVSEWSDRLCLLALASPMYKAASDAVAEAAWRRLGESRGFTEVPKAVRTRKRP